MHETTDLLVDRITGLETRVERLCSMVAVLVEQKTVRDRYTVEQAAGRLGRAPYTVRKWCLERRVNCIKLVRAGHGGKGEWRITHEEIVRVEGHGLLRAGRGQVVEE